MSRIPDGWHRISLDQIAYIQTGIAKGGNNVNDPVYLPYLRVANVQDGYLDLSEIKEIEVDRNRVDRYLLREGDVLLTEGGDFDKLGRGTIWRGEIPVCLHQNHVFAVRVNQDEIMPDFFAMQAASPYGKQYFLSIAKRTTNLASINKAQLSQFPVLLPPLPEQRKIAQILSTWDEAIQVVEALIAALKARKRGLMQRLLTGEVRFPGFDGEWEEVRLGEITEINPRKPSRIRDDLQVSFVGMADVSDDARLMTSDTKTYSEVSNGFTYFQDQDVLIAKITPCLENGKGALVSGLLNSIGFGSTEFHVLRANPEKVLPEYIYYHSISYPFRQRGARNMVGSAGQKRIQTSFVFSYPVLLPSIEEQSKIIEILNQANETEAELAEYVVLLREQKKGLMQRLLTGEVRVKV